MKTIVLVLAGLILVKLGYAYFEHKSLYYPMRELVQTPADLQIVFEDVFFQTKDRETLHGWFVPSAGSARAVLFCHGNAGNISHRVQRVRFFQAIGVSLFLFDYRGYGRSTGKPSEKGLYQDIDAAYMYLLQQRGIKPQDIIVYGKSLGCAAAVELCTRRTTGCLVLESPFISTAEVARDHFYFLPAPLLSHQRYDNYRKIARVGVPVFFLHGREDEIIPCSHTEKLYARALQPKKKMIFHGDHNTLDFILTDDYAQTMKRLVVKGLL